MKFHIAIGTYERCKRFDRDYELEFENEEFARNWASREAVRVYERLMDYQGYNFRLTMDYYRDKYLDKLEMKGVEITDADRREAEFYAYSRYYECQVMANVYWTCWSDESPYWEDYKE